jgi:hypothetical protein
MDHALFAFLSVGAICLFVVFLPAVTWLGTRQKEREAYYRAETMRRIVEASGDSAKAAMEMLREEERLKRIKSREGLKAGGLINIAVGIGLGIFLASIAGGQKGPWMVCFIPLLIGVALLAYVYLLAAPIEDVPKN